MKKFSIHPVSFIIWIWLFWVVGVLSAIGYIFAIIVHEFGHFFMAKFLGYKLSKFSISPYGFSLSYQQQNFDYRDELKIALAGPMANFVSIIFVLGLWWICPASFFATHDFVTISLLLALFNLLPAYPLDGGRIFVSCASHFLSTKAAKKITLMFNFLLSGLFFLMFLVFLFINLNPTFLLFSCFLFAGALDLNFDSRYEKINVFCKKQKNFSKPVLLMVEEKTKLNELLKKMQTGKTIVFCLIFQDGKLLNLSEKMVINLSTVFDGEKRLGEIFSTKKQKNK